MTNHIRTTLVLALALVARSALAQETTEPAAEPELDAPSTTPPAPTPPAEPAKEPAGPAAPARAMTPEKAPATSASASTTASDVTHQTLHEKGGLFGIGVVIAPKLGGSLGSILLAGAGADLTASLEVGYLLPLPQPVGRDIEVFVDAGYAGPSTEQTVNANDPRLAGGAFHYTLTEHQLAATWGALYRFPIPVDWVRPTIAVGARTVWSNTIVNAESGGQPYGATSETAFDIGFDSRVGADLFVGPGAVCAELGFSWVPANRFILRDTSTIGLGLAVGYRFML